MSKYLVFKFDNFKNVNFGIKASTVRQFLIASGLQSKASKSMSIKQFAKIAQKQTLMVMCHAAI